MEGSWDERWALDWTGACREDNDDDNEEENEDAK